jgi:folate-dependent phosphoribosylglycinamide formyltransferase PurN
MIKIGIITANEIRHKFFRRYINELKICKVKICLAEENKSRQFYQVIKSNNYNMQEKKHFIDRRKKEKKFFEKKIKKLAEIKNLHIIKKEEFNYNIKIFNQFKKLNLDVIICFGSSIIKNPLLSYYKNKIINLHLGISPYYYGSASNFWPAVNNEPQFFGSTIMFLDKGVDTGPIIHQMRPKLRVNDTIHDIGNRIIYDTTKLIEKIIINISKIKIKIKNKKYVKSKIYKKKDFSLKSLILLKKNFKNEMIRKYLNKKTLIDKKYPIIKQKFL